MPPEELIGTRPPPPPGMRPKSLAEQLRDAAQAIPPSPHETTHLRNIEAPQPETEDMGLGDDDDANGS